MKIRIKIGTMPASYMHVCFKRTLPAIGDKIQIKHANHSWEKAEPIIIDGIKVIDGEVLYFAYRD